MPVVNKKSFTEVDYMLTIAIIIILIIGVVGVIFLFFPWLERGVSCIQLQRSYIYEVNTAIEEVLLTGEEQIVRFMVLDCTKCIWYNDLKLEVEYETASESFSTPIVWNEIDTDTGCTDRGGVLVGPRTCSVYITMNYAEVICD